MVPPPSDIPLPHQLALNENVDKSSGSFPPARGQVMRILTLTQNTSAMVFSVFLVPHLASPLVASVAGLEGAEKTMLIARDLYLPLEPYLIYTPLIIHFASTFLKRLLFIIPSQPTNIENWQWQSIKARLPKQIHQIIAYPLSILLISHILTHRLIPSRSESPIMELSPSELGWEFVGYNLMRDWSSWLAYLSISGMGIWHSTVGGMKIVTWLKNRRSRSRSIDSTSKPNKEFNESLSDNGQTGNKQTDKNEIEDDIERVIIVNPPNNRTIVTPKRIMGLRAYMIAWLGIIAIGLYRVKKDTGFVSSVMKVRYGAVFDAAPWAKFWRYFAHIRQ
ncbi:uncharacterized protein L201_002975 [Kwoniella dendrophila CBS 6074]|uniref:Mitochondrial adapter protein MCP1 transmembrane domain-containing protein n=1 Tax=Kwoniella dendrophila CBS 6074 TaxID=1295534 RepID=A0AAX4JSE9_9TREE